MTTKTRKRETFLKGWGPLQASQAERPEVYMFYFLDGLWTRDVRDGKITPKFGKFFIISNFQQKPPKCYEIKSIA